MDPVPVRDGQNGRVDGSNLHDHDPAAQGDEKRTEQPLHWPNATGKAANEGLEGRNKTPLRRRVP